MCKSEYSFFGSGKKNDSKLSRKDMQMCKIKAPLLLEEKKTNIECCVLTLVDLAQRDQSSQIHLSGEHNSFHN